LREHCEVALATTTTTTTTPYNTTVTEKSPKADE